MFGPLACELYLWAVWEDTPAYLHTHTHTYTCITQMRFTTGFSSPKKHTYTHGESHTARGAKKNKKNRCRDSGAFRAGTPQI